jgi:CheY-like chemotaxis protein
VVAATAPAGLLLSDDLIFISRVVGIARGLGLTLRAARSADELVALARPTPPRCVIVDLDNPGLDLAALTAALAGLTPRPRVVAYGPHVNADLLRAARAAGCDPVLPRSKFVECLEAELPGWLA